MSTSRHPRRMTREEFFDWAQAREEPYEYDGFGPVAMTGGTPVHSQINGNIQFALRSRLIGNPCRPLGSDAGLATTGGAVRYPDTLVTCAKLDGVSRVVPDVVIVFEVLSASSGRLDRVVKLREYSAVPSILRYVIVEATGVGLTSMARADAGAPWTTVALLAGDVLSLPEIGVDVPVDELYENTGLADAGGGEPQR